MWKRLAWHPPPVVEATPPASVTSTGRQSAATSRRCGTCSVRLRSACTKKIGLAAWPQRIAVFFASRGLVGLAEFGARRNPRFSRLVLKEMNCWIFVVIVVFLDLKPDYC